MKNTLIKIVLLYMMLATQFLSPKDPTIASNSAPQIIQKDPAGLKSQTPTTQPTQEPAPSTSKTSTASALSPFGSAPATETIAPNKPGEDPYAIPDVAQEEADAKEAAEKEAAEKAWKPDPANPDLPEQWRVIPGKMKTISQGGSNKKPLLVGLDEQGNPFKFDTNKKTWTALSKQGESRTVAENPLKITKALYGKYGTADGSVRDVTAKVQQAVQGSTLNINVNDGPLGGDPRRGQKKMFWVWWEYNGRKQSTYAFQGDNVTITPDVKTNSFGIWDDDSSRANKRFVAWPSEWKLPEDSNGTFFFTSDAKDDIYIGLKGEDGPFYTLNLGGGGNRVAVIRANNGTREIFRISNSLPAFTGSQSYWVTLDSISETLQVGTGTVEGQSMFFSGPLPAKNLRYFSFSTYRKPYSLANIRVKDVPNNENFTINNGAQQTIPFKDISVAGDESIAAIGTDGTTWFLQDQKWIQIPGHNAEKISLGSANELWGIDNAKSVYRKKNPIISHPGWYQTDTKGISVASSGEGLTLLAGSDQKIYKHNREIYGPTSKSNNWDVLIKPADLGMGNPLKIVALDSFNIAFLDYQKQIWKAIPGKDLTNKDTWINITETLEAKDFCLGIDGSITIIDSKDRIIQRTPTLEEAQALTSARGEIIYGGQIVSLNAGPNRGDSPVWTHGYCPWDPESKNQPPDNHLELCTTKVTPSDYTAAAGSFFMITKKGKDASNDPINFNDEVNIWSLYSMGADAKKNGPLSKEWKWWVDNKADDLNDIIVSLVAHPSTKNGQEVFKLVSPIGKTGPIRSEDKVEIVSMAPNSLGKKVLSDTIRNGIASLCCSGNNWRDTKTFGASNYGEETLAGWQLFCFKAINKVDDLPDLKKVDQIKLAQDLPEISIAKQTASSIATKNTRPPIFSNLKKKEIAIALAIQATNNLQIKNAVNNAEKALLNILGNTTPQEVFAKISGDFFKLASAQIKVDKEALINKATDGIGVFKEIRNYAEFSLDVSGIGKIKPQDARNGLNRDLLKILTIKGFSKENEIKDFGPEKMIQLDKLWSQGVAWVTQSLETPGKATISFLARPADQGNIQVCFNNSLEPDAKWRIIIGGWNNSKARILRGNQIMAEADAKTTHLAQVAPGRFTPYWVSINNGFLMVGVGTPGENVFMSCFIPNPEAIDRYGFSSHDGNVDYTEVSTSGALQAWADNNTYQASESNITLPVAAPKKIVWLKSQLRVPNEGTIAFSAQAKHSVTLVLQNAKKENYKVVIGANKNKELRIMKGEGKPALQIFTGQTGQGKLFANKNIPFWVSIQGGRFIIGQGNPGENTFGVWEDQLAFTGITNVGFETTDHQQKISDFKFSPPATIGTEQKKSTYDQIVDRFPYKGSVLLIRYFEFQFAQDGQYISAKDMVTGQIFHIFPTPQQGARYILKLDIQVDGTPSVTQLEGPHEDPAKIELNRQAALADINAEKLKDQANGLYKASESLGAWSTGSGAGSIIASVGSLAFTGIGAGVYAAGSSDAASAAKKRLAAQLGYRADDSPVFTETVNRASGLKPGDIPDAAVENRKIITDLLNQARFLSFEPIPGKKTQSSDFAKLLSIYLDVVRRVSHAYVVEDPATKQSIYDALDEFQDTYKSYPELYPKVISLFIKAFSNNYLTSSNNKSETLRKDRWYTAMLDICSNIFEQSFTKENFEIEVAELRGEYLWVPRQFVGGTGSVTFEARGQNDVFVCFAQQDYKVKDPNNNIYEVDFGAWENTTIEARIRSLGKPAIKIAATDNPAYRQLMLNPRRFQTYWINFDNGKIQIGFGDAVGENMFMEWQDPFPWKDIKYIGFGSWNVPVTIRNVKLTNVKPVEGTVDLDEEISEVAQPEEETPQDRVDAESADLAEDEGIDEEIPAEEEIEA